MKCTPLMAALAFLAIASRGSPAHAASCIEGHHCCYECSDIDQITTRSAQVHMADAAYNDPSQPRSGSMAVGPRAGGLVECKEPTDAPNLPVGYYGSTATYLDTDEGAACVVFHDGDLGGEVLVRNKMTKVELQNMFRQTGEGCKGGLELTDYSDNRNRTRRVTGCICRDNYCNVNSASMTSSTLFLMAAAILVPFVFAHGHVMNAKRSTV